MNAESDQIISSQIINSSSQENTGKNIDPALINEIFQRLCPLMLEKIESCVKDLIECKCCS
jgi:hypothetical protein